MTAKKVIEQLWAREKANSVNSLGYAKDLFKGCSFTPHANEGKQPGYMFKKDKKRIWVGLSKRLQPAFETGELKIEQFFHLPIYHVEELKDQETGEVILDEDGNPQYRLVFGTPETKGNNVDDIKTEKIEKYEPVTENTFDEYLA